jgi:hypothetical protein
MGQNHPRPLRGISPKGGDNLLPFMEFLPPPWGVPEGQGGYRLLRYSGKLLRRCAPRNDRGSKQGILQKKPRIKSRALI